MDDLLREIWCYTYYGLVVETPEGLRRVTRRGDMWIDGYVRLEDLSDDHLKEWRPVLYPPEVLVHGAPFHGRSYIPLQGMAAMCYKTGTDVSKHTALEIKDGFYAIQIDQTIFGYDIETQSFLCIDQKKKHAIPVKRQWEMFGLMFLLNIDFLGLIRAGKALSVRDLPQNPYE